MFRFKLGTYILVTIILLLVFSIIVPLITIGGHSKIPFEVFSLRSELGFVYLKSIIFSIVSSVCCVLFGFIFSQFISGIKFNSPKGRKLIVFLLPMTLGNLTIAFLFKQSLFNTAFFSGIIKGGMYMQYLALLIIQIWQYGFLFIYLFWVNTSSLSQNKIEIAKAYHFSYWVKLRDIILPHSRNLIILLFLLGFVFSLYDDSKNQFLFKASQGTETELINHLLMRTYQSYLLINPQYASEAILQSSIVIIFYNIVIFFLTLFCINYIILLPTKSKFFFKIKFINLPLTSLTNKFRSVVPFLLVILVILPFFLTAWRTKISLHTDQDIFIAVLMSGIAAITAGILSILFGISAKLAFPKILQDFNTRSTIFFLLLFALLLIPPICILISGFKWMAWLGYDSTLILLFIWILAHSFTSLPILASFIVVNHFRLSMNELDYLHATKVPLTTILSVSFLKRFQAEYILTIIFAFSFIWNESTINKIYSDKIPSYTSNLEMLITGRGADYSKAFGFVLISICLSCCCLALWNYILFKSEKLSLNNEGN